jgi:hypothetical protein
LTEPPILDKLAFEEVVGMNHREFECLGFDLSYLALLTGSGLKRLSRWEGSLSPEQEQILSDLGLGVTRVRRRLRFGRKAEETVFSTRAYYRELYRRRFQSRRIKESPSNMRLKGFLFGYPSCCVESFIRDRYARNGLMPRDQKILFHWACPGCKTTRSLLREYRIIHDECLRIFKSIEAAVSDGPEPQRLPVGIAQTLGRRAVPVALGLSAMFLLPQAGGAYRYRQDQAGLPLSQDPHLLPVADDADGDYLSHGEEILRGFNAGSNDTDQDGVIDGIEEALMLHTMISALPETEQADQPYRINHWARGMEYCEVCGAFENMGFATIVNPMRSMSVGVPFICLHYLEHGSLSYAGTYHLSGRLDLAGIKRVLLADDETHLESYPYYHHDYDSDHDGLGDREEAMIGTHPDSIDTDGDSVKDGPQFLEGLVESIAGLPRELRPDEPYLIEHPAFGLEACDSCGAIFNMGFVEIINPLEGITLEMPYIGLHYLARGSCSYSGSAHAGRVLPTVLRSVLTGTCNSHWIPVEDDGDGDGLKDAEEPHFGLNPADPDSDGDGMNDGPELAMAMAHVISGLPVGERPDQTYVIHAETDGYVYCLVCGHRVNMGMMEIINPVAGTSFNLGYINHHYMEHGSFFGDYPEFSRIDPRDLDDVIDMSSNASVPHVPASGRALTVYPNPFRESTRIVCGLYNGGRVNLSVFDASGREVRDFTGIKSGDGIVEWDGRDSSGRRLPPGVYFIRMKLEYLSLSRKIVILE